MCDCCEEKQRRQRALEKRRQGLPPEEGEAGINAGPGDADRPRFSMLQIVAGSSGFLLGLMALSLKIMDQDTAHAILDKVGLGYLIPKRSKRCDGLRLSPKKRRWPIEKKSQE